MKSQGLEKQKASTEDTSFHGYSGTEAEAFRFYKDRLEKSRQARLQSREEFDGMDFENFIVANRQSKNSYLRPKRNDSEVRVSTGEVERKVDAVANELLAMNLQSEIQCFDENDMEISSLGNDFEDIVKRTNQIERDDDVWQEAINQILYLDNHKYHKLIQQQEDKLKEYNEKSEAIWLNFIIKGKTENL